MRRCELHPARTLCECELVRLRLVGLGDVEFAGASVPPGPYFPGHRPRGIRDAHREVVGEYVRSSGEEGGRVSAVRNDGGLDLRCGGTLPKHGDVAAGHVLEHQCHDAAYATDCKDPNDGRSRSISPSAPEKWCRVPRTKPVELMPSRVSASSREPGPSTVRSFERTCAGVSGEPAGPAGPCGPAGPVAPVIRLGCRCRQSAHFAVAVVTSVCVAVKRRNPGYHHAQYDAPLPGSRPRSSGASSRRGRSAWGGDGHDGGPRRRAPECVAFAPKERREPWTECPHAPGC